MVSKSIICTVALTVLAGAAIAAPTSRYRISANEYVNGSTNMAIQVSNADALNGAVGTSIGAGTNGWYAGAAAPTDNVALTNGSWDAGGVVTLVQDVDQAGSVQTTAPMRITYTFGSPTTITDIVIFTGHDQAGEGSRAFGNFDIEVDTGSGFTVLLDDVYLGELGLDGALYERASGLVRVFDDAFGSLATGVVGLRISSWCATHNSNRIFSEVNGDITGDGVRDGGDAQPYPNQGSIIKEIDVYTTSLGDVTPDPAPTSADTWTLFI